MLEFKKEIHISLIEKCENDQLDSFFSKNETEIRAYSETNGIDINDIIKQIRLHLPLFEHSIINSKQFFIQGMIPLLDKRFNNYLTSLNYYFIKCGIDSISNFSNLHLKGNSIVEKNTNKKIADFEVHEVNEDVAKFIECELHYLHSFRKESKYRIGLFIKDYSHPLCYMSFCDIDRKDKIDAIQMSLGFNSYDYTKTIELSRVFGCGKLPYNTISFLISQGTKYYRKLGYEYLITAVNPYLGFTGTSMIAYCYSQTSNEYITSRNSELRKQSNIEMPPNILYIKEVQKISRLTPVKIVSIKNDGISFLKISIKKDIFKLRGSLEVVWNDITRYHGTNFHSSDHPSKGQCGVSSLHLAKHLQSRGYNVKFCEGNVHFPEDEKSIYNHCWIKLLNYGNEGVIVIIDITADQNGYEEKVIFKNEKDLISQNIRYESISEYNVNEVGVEHLIDRLTYLENLLEERNK